jgi:hypothetical protein
MFRFFAPTFRRPLFAPEFFLPVRQFASQAKQESIPPDPSPARALSDAEHARQIAEIHEQLSDPEVVTNILSKLPGVDPSDPVFEAYYAPQTTPRRQRPPITRPHSASRGF